MAQLLSADLLPELDSPSFPTDFPYEVFHSLPSDTSEDDDDCDYAPDVDLFSRRLTQPLSFSGIPTRPLSTPSSYRCDADPVSSASPKSTLGGTGNWSTSVGVLRLPHPNSVLFPSDSDHFDLVYAAVSKKLARLKVGSVEPQFRTCRPDNGVPCRLIPKQEQFPSSLNHDPFFLPRYTQYTLRRHAREAEVIKQRHDALLLAQQRQQRIEAQIRARKSGFAEGSRFGRTYSFSQPGWASKAGSGITRLSGNGSRSEHVCAGTGVFLPRGYCDVAPESRKNSGDTTPMVVVPAKVVRALNANVQLHGRDALIPARRNALWMHQHNPNGGSGFDF